MTTTSTTNARPIEPPARQTRLLTRLTIPAAVGFGLLTLWLATTTLANVRLLFDGSVTLGAGLVPVVVSLLLDAAFALVAGLITYRLAVVVPRVVRGWEDALAERTAVLLGRPGRSASPR